MFPSHFWLIRCIFGYIFHLFSQHKSSCFGFSSETVSGKDCVVATFDGWSFYPIWISATASTVGKSVRTVTGITYENEVKIICDYTTTIPDWKIVTVKVDID